MKLLLMSLLLLSTNAPAQLAETIGEKYRELPEVYIDQKTKLFQGKISNRSGDTIQAICEEPDVKEDNCVKFRFYYITAKNRPYGYPLHEANYSFGQMIPVYSDAEKVFHKKVGLKVLPLTKLIYGNGIYRGLGFGIERSSSHVSGDIITTTSLASLAVGGLMFTGAAATAAAAPFVLAGGIALFSLPTAFDFATLPVRSLARGVPRLFGELNREKKEKWFEEDLVLLLKGTDPQSFVVNDRRFKSLTYGIQKLALFLEKPVSK